MAPESIIFNQRRITFFYFQEDTEAGKIIPWEIPQMRTYTHLAHLLNLNELPKDALEKTRLLIRDGWPRRRVREILVPWATMWEHRQRLPKFFGAGFYSKNFVGIPKSFNFQKTPEDDSLLLPLNSDCVGNIVDFLTVSDQLNISASCKPWLRKIRSNMNVKRMAENNYWFYDSGYDGIKRIFGETIKTREFLEYEMWWYCFTASIIQDLWERWESYFGQEIGMEQAIARNRNFWYDTRLDWACYSGSENDSMEESDSE